MFEPLKRIWLIVKVVYLTIVYLHKAKWDITISWDCDVTSAEPNSIGGIVYHKNWTRRIKRQKASRYDG